MALAAGQTDSPHNDESGVYELDSISVSGNPIDALHGFELRRAASQITDFQLESEIKALPHKSAADVLNQFPGVQSERNRAQTSSLTIRGFEDITTTLDGEQVFTGASRAFSLADLPAELLSFVSIVKGREARHISSGIGGLVALRMRQPFDSEQSFLEINLGSIYERNSDELSTNASLVASTVWELNSGARVGVLLSGSEQDSSYQVQGSGRAFWTEKPVGPNQELIRFPDVTNMGIQVGDRQNDTYRIATQFETPKSLILEADIVFIGSEEAIQTQFLNVIPTPQSVVDYEIAEGTDNVASELTLQNGAYFVDPMVGNDLTDTETWITSVSAEFELGNTTLTTSLHSTSSDSEGWHPGLFFTKSNLPRSHLYLSRSRNVDLDSTELDLTQWDNTEILLWREEVNPSSGKENIVKLDASSKDISLLFPLLKWGFRFAERSITARNGESFRFYPESPTAASSVEGIGRITEGQRTGFGDLSILDWYSPNGDYVYNSPDEIRNLFGLASGPPPTTDENAIDHRETDFSAYLQNDYIFSLKEYGIEGSVGIRIEETKRDLTGFERGEPVSSDTDRFDVLPYWHTRFALSNSQFFKASVNQTVTHPTFFQLNPRTRFNPRNGQASGGNPLLNPIEATNLDLAYECYYGASNFFTATLFYRDISGLIYQSFEREEIDGEATLVERPRNAGDGHIGGIEISWRHFLDGDKGLGVSANYTQLSGHSYYPLFDSVAKLPLLSTHSGNLGLIYKTNKLSLNVAYGYRGPYLNGYQFNFPTDDPNHAEWSAARNGLDLKILYQFSDYIELSASATNLLDQAREGFWGQPDSPYRSTVSLWDRTFEIGLRLTY